MASNNHIGETGKWRTPSDIKLLKEEILPGDRVEFLRSFGFAHWGIYVGRYSGIEHAVIHFGIFEGAVDFSIRKTSGIAASADNKPEIRADSIATILGGSGKARINNSRDKQQQPLRTDAIVELAKEMEKEKPQIDYNVVLQNCEDFVNACRYGDTGSEQVKDLLSTVVLGQTAGSLFAVLLNNLKSLFTTKQPPK